MLASALSTLWKRLGFFAEPDADPAQGEALARQIGEITAVFQKPAADGAAATATASTKGNGVNGINGSFTNPFTYDLVVTGFLISANATLTASDTDFATISVQTDDAADGAPANAVALTTAATAPGSGNWAVDVAQVVREGVTTKGVFTPASQRLRPGANLFIAIAKSGAGVVVPISTITVLMRKI